MREAYRQIQEHSDGDYQLFPGLEGRGAASRAQASSSSSPLPGRSLRPTSTDDSGEAAKGSVSWGVRCSKKKVPACKKEPSQCLCLPQTCRLLQSC